MEDFKQDKFKTDIVNLKCMENYNYSIPTYQRPYVWKDEQIKKILDDFYKTFKSNPNEKYYIGTFLTKDKDFYAELIDGQQRFTTLWLISFTISKICKSSRIINFLRNNENKLRLSFEIRHEISEFLNDLLKDDSTTKKIHEEALIESYPYLKNIAKGLVYIDGYVNQLPKTEVEAFGNFIYENVYFIKNTTN
jgi:uncharacterized protein with ParB-like and HNH nuclease domain